MPDFKVQIRRIDDSPTPFSLRFEVTDGRGTFVLPQRAGHLTAPACTEDMVEGLSAEALTGVRFLVIDAQQQERVEHRLGPFTEAELKRVPGDSWGDLLICKMRDGSHLVYHPALKTPRSRRSVPWKPSDVRKKIPQTPDIENLTGALERERRRSAVLTQRIGELERLIEDLGGTVVPFEVDTR